MLPFMLRAPQLQREFVHPHCSDLVGGSLGSMPAPCASSNDHRLHSLHRGSLRRRPRPRIRPAIRADFKDEAQPQ